MTWSSCWSARHFRSPAVDRCPKALGRIAHGAPSAAPVPLLYSTSLGLRSALRFGPALRLRDGLGVETLGQLGASCCAIPLLEGLRRDVALDQQLGKLPALRFAFDWHGRFSRPTPLPRSCFHLQNPAFRQRASTPRYLLQ